MTIPASLDAFLTDMEYPATKDDLLREAVRDGLSPSDRALLDDLPDQSFGARWHIRYFLARASLAGALFGRPLAST